MSIIPTPPNGGLPIRDINGNPVTQSNVQNAYNPSATFTFDSELNYLPSDCTARITPSQINSFQSELICLAATLCPDGSWSALTNCNLSAAFSCWDAQNGLADQVTIGGDGSISNPYTLLPIGSVQRICGNNTARVALAACLIDPATGNILAQGPNGLLYVDADVVANAICGDASAIMTLAACLIDPTPGNDITIGPGGRLYLDIAGIDPAAIVAAICGNVLARNALAACLISSDPNNQLVTGSDGRLFVPQGGGGGPGTVPSPTDPFPIGSASMGTYNTLQCNAVVVGSNNLANQGTYTYPGGATPTPHGGPDQANGGQAGPGAGAIALATGRWMVTGCTQNNADGSVNIHWVRIG